MRILVVDDEPKLRLILAEDLEQDGHLVVQAANATDAIAMICSGAAFDLVLTDIDMPGWFNGMELAEFVREVAPATKIILVSGGGHAAEQLPSVDLFIRKPTTSRHLRTQVALTLSPRRDRPLAR